MVQNMNGEEAEKTLLVIATHNSVSVYTVHLDTISPLLHFEPPVGDVSSLSAFNFSSLPTKPTMVMVRVKHPPRLVGYILPHPEESKKMRQEKSGLKETAVVALASLGGDEICECIFSSIYFISHGFVVFPMDVDGEVRNILVKKEKLIEVDINGKEPCVVRGYNGYEGYYGRKKKLKAGKIDYFKKWICVADGSVIKFLYFVVVSRLTRCYQGSGI